MANLTEYERQRQENIERNRELLAQFNLTEARNALSDGVPSPSTPQPEAVKIVSRKRKQAPKRIEKPLAPQRKSSRLRGEQPAPIEIDEAESGPIPATTSSTDAVVDDELWDGKLLTADEYFSQEIRDKAIRTDGNYKGWLDPQLIEKYQFEASATDAWEKNGGGTFSYKDPLGTGKKRSGNTRVNAKAVAQMMFKKNPNMYFYRHNEPGVIAKEYGCGDKWGLFASYIPHRVGYQCSNYYRSEILPAGLIFDKNYEYTPSGRPIYVGGRRTRSS
ncbi:hypothetical protein BCR43DRAFT_511214 [Syncephalastrum racemosum]|uniref:DNA damage-binding protein CMR1 n=1 Tax=Syncephalastrum racemosum TaxID=13706 RepID=A0A1X2HLC6_SYNRA|nr:hypothetical protein BCR43DRAFT_511214 [Syncephalastrum racemosum]